MAVISVPPGTINIYLNSAGNFLYNGTEYSGVITIINTDPTSTLTVNFNSQGNTITNAGNYIFLASAYITFDGLSIPINVNTINFLGLIIKTSDAFNFVIVQNVFINAVSGSTIISSGGWVIQQNSSNITVNNCTSNGSIPAYGGGIVGATCRNITCNYCSSSGNMDTYAGGIIGAYLQKNLDTTIVVSSATNCFSTGTIGNFGGGIFGYQVNNGSKRATCTATGCYSTGNIGTSAGGIYGDSAQSNMTVAVVTGNYGCYANYCYSLGDINTAGGGIYGSNALTSVSVNNNTCNATNCYSCGIVSGGGGIFGNNASFDSLNNTCIAIRCYTLKSTSIFGATPKTVTQTNCYGANNTWNTNTANTQLNTSGNPGIWTSVANNTPFVLDYFNTWDYSTRPVPSGYLYTFSINATQAVAGYFASQLGDPNVYPSTGLIYGYTQVNTNAITVTLGSINVTVNGNFFSYNSNKFSAPLTIQNIGATDLTVNFNSQNTSNLISNSYIILDSDKITFNGQNIPININVANYPGFLRKTGTFSNINIQNVVVNTISAGASLISDGGWIGQTGWNGGNFINCTSSGTVPANSGGIVGRYSSNTSCVGCYQFGNVANDAGSIFGSNTQTGNAAQCFVKGSTIAGNTSTNINFVNCYSFSLIPGGYLAYNLMVDNE